MSLHFELKFNQTESFQSTPTSVVNEYSANFIFFTLQRIYIHIFL